MATHISRIPAVGLVLVVASLAPTSARQPAGGAVQVDADDLGGVVSGAKGPEAGVWVIAETTDLPTKFARIVVTDDRGRYLIPDLPKAERVQLVAMVLKYLGEEQAPRSKRVDKSIDDQFG